jgi:nitrogen fixation NifU-like protein
MTKDIKKNSIIEGMYKEIILDHWRYPKNKGLLKNFDLEGHGINTICGDRLLIRLKITGGVVGDVSFDGEGCAISLAFASLLTENIKGKNKNYLEKLTKDKVLALLPVEILPSRLKCALLPMEAIGAALAQEG